MELVDGEALDRLIPKDGLEFGRLLDISIPLADAISAAHERGIVHRDLKPANVMVGADGQVKVLDFGLAKLQPKEVSAEELSAVPTLMMTREGVVMGTAPYMSPEQARGTGMDHRTDIFSLGIMLYEMATGARPFGGDTAVELVSAILKDTPRSLTAIRVELPRHLSRVVGRCLEKEPLDRYQTARDVLNELRVLQKESSSASSRERGANSEIRNAQPHAPWIAVLPFKCQTADPDLENFADGLTEDITTGLSRFSYLLVISRNSARNIKGESVDVRQVGQDLGARYIIEGAVRKGGSKMRVNVQVVDTRTGTHLWAETFDRNLNDADIFDVQDEITDWVVATVADPYGVLARSMAAPTASKPAESLTAYEAVLRYFVYQQRVCAEDHLVARIALERAVEFEPDYADAWAALAICVLDEDRHSFNPGPNALDRALQAAQRAVEADPANQLANFSLAQVHYFRKDIGAFRSAAERAIELNQRDSNTMAMAGILMGYSGDWERAVKLTTTAMKLNPHHPGWYRFSTFFNEYRQGRYGEALAIVQKINMPDYFATHYTTAIAQAQLGNVEAARAAAQETLRLWPKFEQEFTADHMDKWLWAQPDLIAHVLDGLELAGLDVHRTVKSDGEGNRAVTPVPLPQASIAVLPFKNLRRPFVGRDAERLRLNQMLEEAVQGSGSLALLGGEPGVGKTRLASEILEDARERGMLALAGHAYEEEGAPFIIAAEILEEMLRRVDGAELRRLLGDNASELSRLLPDLRRHFPDIPEPEDLPPEQQRRYLFNSVLEFLTRASAEQPMVMLLDDLHWADESSLLLLEHVAPILGELSILMIGTYRDVELEIGRPFAKTLASLVRTQHAHRVPVRRFGDAEVSALLASLGRPDPPPALVEEIFKETEGNPFFVTEVFEHLVEEGLLFDDAGRWLKDLEVAQVDVPEGVRLVIGRRLERLDPATTKILVVAAVIGLRFDLAVVEEAAGGDSDAALDAIEEAEAARLVAPLEGRRSPRYEFVHALVRQTLANTLSLPRKQRLHLRVAEAMERAYGSRAEEHAGEIAHHLYQAGAAAEEEKTRSYLEIAGRRSMDAAAADEALLLFDRALELDGDLEELERAQLLFLRGQVHRTLGRWPEAASDWEVALPVLESNDEADTVAEICESMSLQRLWANEIEEAKAFGFRGLEAVGETSSRGRCRLLATLGHAHGNGGDYDAAEDLNNQAIAMAEESGDERLLGVALIGRLYQCEHWAQARRQVETSERAIALARRSGTAWDLCNVLGASCFGNLAHGRRKVVEEIIEELHPQALKHGHVGGEVHVLWTKQFLTLWEGDLLASREAIRRSLVRCSELKIPWNSITLTWAGSVEYMLGKRDRAMDFFEKALADEVSLTFAGGERAYLLKVLAYADQTRARTIMDSLRDRLPKAGKENPNGAWHAGMATIEAAVVLGEPEPAAALYPCAVQLIEAGVVNVWVLGLTERFAGIAAAAAGEWDLAEGHFQNALRQAEEIPHRLEQPEVKRWHAHMLLERNAAGDRGRAESMLAEARTAYSDMGMPFYVELVDIMLANG